MTAEESDQLLSTQYPFVHGCTARGLEELVANSLAEV